MVLRDRFFGFALCLLGASSLARAGDDHGLFAFATAAPMNIPHAQQLDLGFKARKPVREPAKIEASEFHASTPGLTPVTWPKYSDVRARLLTPQLRNTPVVGWIAENLYRPKKDNGWCLEIDPGEGQYVIFYRTHLK